MLVEAKTWRRDAAVTVMAGVITAVAFLYQQPVPFLDLFDLGVHEAGHLLAAPLPRLAMFLAGSIAQVALPVALAWYFGVHRGDRAAAGLCLAWAGTSARDVSVYASDAVTLSLPLIGGEHDWAYILGPRGFDALEHTATVAASIEWLGAALAVGGTAVAAWSVYQRRSTASPVVVLPPAYETVGSAPGDPWRAGTAGRPG